MSMMVWSPAPLSDSSVTRVWRVSCHRPMMPAFFLMLHQTVFKLVMGRVASKCLDLPKGNRYHPGRVIPYRRVYQREWFSSAGNRTEFKGIVRPSPASVL